MISTELRIKELLRRRRWTTKVLAEKTGLSESYLTHIKNGTRRWNQDSLKKLADAFEMPPYELFTHRKAQKESKENAVTQELVGNYTLQQVPVIDHIPKDPFGPERRNAQSYVPVFNSEDEALFCYRVSEDTYAPVFEKNDLLIISPYGWTRSGDIAAVEWMVGTEMCRDIKRITYMDEFIVLNAVNHKGTPIALVRGKDHFQVIGKVVYRYQNF